MAAQRQLFVNISRALLTFAAALSLTRVFAGGSWIGAIAVAALAPALLFALVQWRRWNPAMAFVLCAVFGLWLALAVDDPSDLAAGLPTGTALSVFRTDLGNAPHVLRSATVPVVPAGAALLLAVVATYVCAMTTEIVARRLDAPIGAMGPSVALFVAVAALGSGRWAPTTAVYGLVAIAYLVSLQEVEVAARRTWFQTGRARRSQAVTGGIIAGALIVAFAIAIGPAFPGAKSAAWINYRKLGSGKGSSELEARSPFLSIGDKLNNDPTEKILSVETSNHKAYRWRTIALDSIDTKGSYDWILSAKRGSASQLPKATHAPGTEDVTQSFHVYVTAEKYWLPAVYAPTKVVGLSGVETLPSSATIFLPGGAVAGVDYQVQSEVQTPTTAELESVQMADLAPMSSDTQLPRGLVSDKVAELTHQLTDGTAKPYDKALALQSFFQSNAFVYDTTVNYSSSPDALAAFVLQERRGFCEQFAAAFAEMARYVGLPTRIAVGYQTGTPQGTGSWVVHGADAHAWPEVWLGSKIGWYAFEPTKGKNDPATGQGAAATTPATTPSATTPNSAGSATPTTVPQSAPNTPQSVPNSINVPPPPASKHAHSGLTSALTVLLVLIGLALLGALIFVGWLVFRSVERTRRRRHAQDNRKRVLGAWTEAIELLGAAGVEPRPSATSIEFALRHAPAHGAGDAGPPLMELARLHTAAMFAAEPPSDDDANAAWELVDQIGAALRESVGRTAMWRTRLRPRPWERAEREREPADDADIPDDNLVSAEP
jgi:transglutaminase-like putative cysteine protease